MSRGFVHILKECNERNIVKHVKWICRFITAGILLFSFWLGNLSAQNSVAFIPASTQAKIPFQNVNDFLIVKVKVGNSRPLNLLFDTGSQHTVIFNQSSLSSSSDIQYVRQIELLGSDMSRRIEAQISVPLPIQLDKNLSVLRSVLVMDETEVDLEKLLGLKVDGILGMDLFKNCLLHIDYRKQKIRLIADKNRAKNIKSHSVIPARFDRYKPHIYTTFSHANSTQDSVLLLMDSGSSIPFVLHANTIVDYTIPPQVSSGILGVGLGGYIHGHKGKVDRIEWKDISIPDQMTHFQDVSISTLDCTKSPRNGLIGNHILQYLDPIIDFNNEDVLVRPNIKKLKKRQVDLSGLFIISSGKNFDKFLIVSVMKESPAELVGLRQNDIILSINGRKARHLDLEKINHILSKEEGKRIKLKVLREGEIFKTQFVLKEYP